LHFEQHHCLSTKDVALSFLKNTVIEPILEFEVPRQKKRKGLWKVHP